MYVPGEADRQVRPTSLSAQRCFNSTSVPAAGKLSTAWPLIFTVNPAPAHDGRRKARVKVLRAPVKIFRLAASPSGKSVWTSIFTFPVFQSAIEGV
jgi:hypothetical protein